MCEHQYNSLTEYFLAHRRVSRHAQVCFVNPNPVAIELSFQRHQECSCRSKTNENKLWVTNNDLMSFFQGYVVLFVYIVIKIQDSTLSILTLITIGKGFINSMG